MLREEPLKLLQSPLQVKDLFGQVGDDLFEAPAVAGFQRRIAKPRFGRLELSLENLQVDCTLWERIFATLKQRFRLFASFVEAAEPRDRSTRFWSVGEDRQAFVPSRAARQISSCD